MSRGEPSAPPPVLPCADELPWQVRARQRLETALQAQRLPHALLLNGPAGVGKDRFAAWIAATLVCGDRSAGFRACGRCADCRLSTAGTHPDVHWVQRPDGKKAIPVDLVRELAEDLAMTSMRNGYRVAIVAPADAMTVNAQNALLKTLEEPAARTMIVLVTARPSRVLATLRSRCQRVEIARPDVAVALQWLATQLGGRVEPRLLQLAGGAPLRALELAPHLDFIESQMSAALEALLAGRAEVTALAEPMVGEGLPARLDWIENWLGLLARVRLAGATNVTIPGGSAMQEASRTVNMTIALRLTDRVREVRSLLDGSAQPQLAVEALLLDIAAAFAGPGDR